MNGSCGLLRHLALAVAVATATAVAAVAAPRLAGATTPPQPVSTFGSNVAVNVLPARELDVDMSSDDTGLHSVACSAGAAAGTRCFVSTG